MPSLLIETGPRKGKILPLTREKTTLGRDLHCDIVLDERLVVVDSATSDQGNAISRHHAVISRCGTEYVIADGDGRTHRSKNLTYVNGTRIPHPPTTYPLRDGDQIRMCGFVCTFQLDPRVCDDDDSSISVDSSLGSPGSVMMLATQPANQLQVILQISNELSHTLELAELLSRLLDHLLRLFPQAERGIVLLRDKPDDLPTVRAFKCRQGGNDLSGRVSLSIIRRCMEKVEAILGNDPRKKFPESESLNDLPLRSVLCAPLWSQDGKALGAIQLDNSRPSTPRFAEHDLKLLLGVAGQASVAVVNAQLHRAALSRQQRERDLSVAREVQLALLPQVLPTISHYAFYAHYQAAQEVGGDYYDFVPLPGGRLAVLVGDVTGKGVPAALVMAKFSVEARVCLETEPDLGVAISRLNALMVRARLGERFVTLTAVVLDPAAPTLTVVNAGHPSPLVCRGASPVVEEAAPRAVAGAPLGLFPGEIYTAREIPFGTGDGLVLFSDGVSEAMNAEGEVFGKARIRLTLAEGALAPHEVGKRLLQAVKTHAAGHEQSDDIVLVCVRQTGCGAGVWTGA